MREMSALEILRESNLKENKEVLSKLLAELKEFRAVKPKPKKSVKKQKQVAKKNSLVIRRNPTRNARFEPFSRTRPTTRSQTRRGSVSSSNSSASSSPSKEHGRLLIKFGRYGHRSLELYDDSDDEDDRPRSGRGRRSSHNATERDIRPPEDITKEEIENVADYSTKKTYNQTYGATCHQCRQKTIDTKTICRNTECPGVRGQFCGPCLRNRYGEDAREALKDPDWECPPCRGICNCSICRNRDGKAATGILIHLAKERGFDNVASFLESLRKST